MPIKEDQKSRLLEAVKKYAGEFRADHSKPAADFEGKLLLYMKYYAQPINMVVRHKADTRQFVPTNGWHKYESQGSNWLGWSSGHGIIKISLPNATQVTMQGEIIARHPQDNIDIFANGQEIKTLSLV